MLKVALVPQKLLIYQRDFKQACHLQGIVRDGFTNDIITDASIGILDDINENTNLLGFYQTASVNSGTFQVVYSATGYLSDTLTVILVNGIMTTQDVTLYPLIMILAFSPNGDGLNDFFTLFLKPESYVDYNIKIYNKWHHLIYNEDNTPWDGKLNDVLLNNGSYSYYITVFYETHKPVIYTGLINLF